MMSEGHGDPIGKIYLLGTAGAGLEWSRFDPVRFSKIQSLRDAMKCYF